MSGVFGKRIHDLQKKVKIKLRNLNPNGELVR